MKFDSENKHLDWLLVLLLKKRQTAAQSSISEAGYSMLQACMAVSTRNCAAVDSDGAVETPSTA